MKCNGKFFGGSTLNEMVSPRALRILPMIQACPVDIDVYVTDAVGAGLGWNG